MKILTKAFNMVMKHQDTSKTSPVIQPTKVERWHAIYFDLQKFKERTERFNKHPTPMVFVGPAKPMMTSSTLDASNITIEKIDTLEWSMTPEQAAQERVRREQKRLDDLFSLMSSDEQNEIIQWKLSQE